MFDSARLRITPALAPTRVSGAAGTAAAPASVTWLAASGCAPRSGTGCASSPRGGTSSSRRRRRFRPSRSSSPSHRRRRQPLTSDIEWLLPTYCPTVVGRARDHGALRVHPGRPPGRAPDRGPLAGRGPGAAGGGGLHGRPALGPYPARRHRLTLDPSFALISRDLRPQKVEPRPGLSRSRMRDFPHCGRPIPAPRVSARGRGRSGCGRPAAFRAAFLPSSWWRRSRPRSVGPRGGPSSRWSRSGSL